MLKAYKYRLYPSKEQEVLLSKHFGATRWLYNWALDKKQKQYLHHQENLPFFELCKMLTFIKKTDELNWLNEISGQALQNSLANLEHAFTLFFKHSSKYPKFKKKNEKQT